MSLAHDLVLRLRSVTDAFRTDAPVRELDQLELSLQATGRQATQSARQVRAAADDLDAPGFDRAAAEAETTARRMRTAAEDMERGLRSGARGIDAATDGIRRDLADTGKEAGAEFVGNIAEGIGSGQARLDDIVSGTLGGLTNLAATMTGPVGLAAAGAAAGIGLVFSAIKGQAEKAKERIDSISAALDGIADKSGEVAQKRLFDEWVEKASQTIGKLENTRDVLEEAGVKADDFRKAIAGDPAALARVTGQLQAQSRAIVGSVDNMNDLTDEQRRYLDLLPPVLKELAEQDRYVGATRRKYEAIDDLLGTGRKKTRAWNGDLSDAAATAAAIKRDLEAATRDRTVNLRYKVTYTSDGRPVRLDDPRQNRGGTLQP